MKVVWGWVEGFEPFSGGAESLTVSALSIGYYIGAALGCLPSRSFPMRRPDGEVELQRDSPGDFRI